MTIAKQSLLEAAKAVDSAWRTLKAGDNLTEGDYHIAAARFQDALEAIGQAVQAEQDVPVYTPMTDDELVQELYKAPDYSDAGGDWGYERHFELTVIKRAGLRVKDKP